MKKYFCCLWRGIHFGNDENNFILFATKFKTKRSETKYKIWRYTNQTALKS